MSQAKKEGAENSKERPPEFAVGQEVCTLNNNDVLLGRGNGASNYVGSVAFRALVDKRKAEYISAHSNSVKDAIAREIATQIRSQGGRFLRLKEGKKKRRKCSSCVTEGIWCIVEEKVALEKCKQALRENRDKSDETHKARGEDRNQRRRSSTETESSMNSDHDRSSVLSVETSPPAETISVHALPTTSLGVHGISETPTVPAVDLSHLFFQQSMFALQQQTAALNLYQNSPMYSMAGALWNLQASQYMQQVAATNMAAAATATATAPPIAVVDPAATSDGSIPAAAPPEPAKAANRAHELNDGSFTTTDDQYHVFTKEQEELERVSMTDKERSAALCDIFGKLCAIAPRQRKRARRDLSRTSIDFLIGQMKCELERIPDNLKPALLEAQVKARAEEFSNERLEKFLRCEGMNAEVAAQRFVNYWESRRELFGPEKYTMRMSLSEALRDDLIALETGFYCLLPQVDLSGRQIIFMEPHRDTKQGYTSESMVRAIWYTIEVLAEANRDIGSGFVCIVRDTNSSIADYDRNVYKRILRYEMNAWPVKLIASHVCCTPSLVLRIVKPILYALTDKRTRTRTNVHDVPENDVPEVLQSYGILKSNLPIELGGSIVINPKEWIASRHAAELEEI